MQNKCYRKEAKIYAEFLQFKDEKDYFFRNYYSSGIGYGSYYHCFFIKLLIG